MIINPLSRPQSRTYRVLVIDAHPRGDSFCRALADATVDGATSASHEVRTLTLRDLDFDLNEKGQGLEAALVHAQKQILWAEHLFIVHPVWWASMPALLKGWLDRTLTSGFAFAEREDGQYEGMLQGRSATLISTLDTPLWVFRWILGAPSVRALRDGTLGFCGIRPVNVLQFATIRDSSREARQRWVEQARLAGLKLDETLRSGWKPLSRAWFQALRPQFYLFPWLALTAGALSSSADSNKPFYWGTYLLAWAGAWLVEGMSVLTNDIHDVETDAANRNSGIFTGGSRVIIDGALSENQLRVGRNIAAWCLVSS
ncbi:MAG: NAD(P)H-dependent oxidoreductase [Verrucomicrobiota bacterium]